LQFFTVVKGLGFHQTELGSFDRALLDANLGNYNLVKISSILPPNCQERKDVDVNYGNILYTAYTFMTSAKGQEFSSAIAVGIPKNKMDIGVIMEYSGIESEIGIKSIVIDMVKEEMQIRGIAVKKIIDMEISSKSKLLKCDDSAYVSTFAAIALWG
jgi:arginine decarboxylase